MSLTSFFLSQICKLLKNVGLANIDIQVLFDNSRQVKLSNRAPFLITCRHFSTCNFKSNGKLFKTLCLWRQQIFHRYSKSSDRNMGSINHNRKKPKFGLCTLCANSIRLTNFTGSSSVQWCQRGNTVNVYRRTKNKLRKCIQLTFHI